MEPLNVRGRSTHAVFPTHYVVDSILWGTVLLGCLLLRMYAILPRKVPSQNSRRTQPCHLAVFLGSGTTTSSTFFTIFTGIIPGGHTSEAITLISSLDFSRYYPRTYIVSQGDVLSAKKASALEFSKASESPSHHVSKSSFAYEHLRCQTDIWGSLQYQGPDTKTPFSLLTIPRARRVHQTFLTTPATALHSLATCLYYVTLSPVFSGEPFADVLILNGPGTCCMLCAAVYVNRVRTTQLSLIRLRANNDAFVIHQLLGLRSPKIIYVESFARVRTLSLSGRLLRPFVDR